ncbi:hypothetical protein VN97_g12048 [Penicillium thymicola]|uniref:Reverse transcriptase Ty1/copia-type domain-containing protein n=1 Tax=Penicillium thymicola TaxID=293382 RepID=A0AAI9T7N6_PENTH|nr:hypothetical protein VN97_g12048 [Penicillium thymicola]
MQPRVDHDPSVPLTKPGDASEPLTNQPPLRRSTRIRKPSRAMLEHLAAHCAGLDPSETAVFADQMNEVVLSVFAAATGNKAATEAEDDNSVPINNKLTPRDFGYIPNGWVDAMNCVEREKWLTAAHIELKAQIKNGTWKTVDRKSNKTNRKPLTLRWVFDIKKDTGRYKARLVARGFNQIKDVDFHEVYAVVAKPMSFKVFCAIAAALNWFLHYIDIKTALLNADIKGTIYIELRENQVAGGAKQIAQQAKEIHAQELQELQEYMPPEDKVGLLMKAVHGLKQSPREWYILLHDALLSMGFQRIHADHSVFVKWLGTGKNRVPIYVLVYVDDVLVLTPSKKAVDAFFQELSKHFNLTDKGPVAEYLGMQVLRRLSPAGGWIALSQKKFIASLLRQYGMQNSKPVATPFNEKDPLVPNPSLTPATPAECKLYQEKVGKVIWLMVTTRADISYTAIQLAKHARNPGIQDEQALKRLFRYLVGTVDLCIWFNRPVSPDLCVSSQQLPLHGYCDADYVGPHSTNGLSTSGFVFHLAGGPISWASKKQACVALSSFESEYIAQALAVQEARWLILLLTELHMHKYALLDKPVVINADNTGAIALAKNPEYHARTKHIAVRYHFLRQETSSGSVVLQYVATQQQAADGLTKPLGATAFRRFVDQIGLRPSHVRRE